MVGMVRASTSAALNADEVRVGTVVAAEMIVKAGILIAIAAAVNLMSEGFKLRGVSEGFKLRGVGAAEPPPIRVTRPRPPWGAFSCVPSMIDRLRRESPVSSLRDNESPVERPRSAAADRGREVAARKGGGVILIMFLWAFGLSEQFYTD
jgi:hypothetical protein